ncbi:MAG: hypothetical protein HC850_10660 [Rhodomicrobium sp.]|nr:hypothetical protein [Rhodomicrobium sp.]
MNKMNNVLKLFLICTLCGSNSLHSQASDDWDDPLKIMAVENDKNHAESYEKIVKALKDKKQNDIIKIIFSKNVAKLDDLGQGDFYTSFTMLNELKDDVWLTDYCKIDSQDAEFQNIELRVTYRGMAGSVTFDFIPKNIIFSAAKFGQGERRGCSFTSFDLKQEGPFLLYQGVKKGANQYELHFSAVNGTVDDESLAQQLVKFAFATVGLIPNITLPTGSQNFATESATLYDNILRQEKAYTLSSQEAAFVGFFLILIILNRILLKRRQ